MEGEFVVYEGRKVPKDNFRAFVYGTDNKRKLVESYEQFEEAMASGIWFATNDEVHAIASIKPKDKKKQKECAETQDEFLANAK